MRGGRCLWEGCGWNFGLADLSWSNILESLESNDKEFAFDIIGHRL